MRNLDNYNLKHQKILPEAPPEKTDIVKKTVSRKPKEEPKTIGFQHKGVS